MTYQQAERQALKFLASEQAEDGSFMGWAGTEINNFVPVRPQPTVFFTALTLQCLLTVPGTAALRQRMASFLLSQRGPRGSWNYWRRDSKAFTHQPYPDDLDDTACALAALAGHDPMLIDGTVLAQIAQLLVAVETKPGGPYGTWLVGKNQAPQWYGSDLAVNANIGFLLASQNVQVPGLNNYITKALVAGELTSSYYVGELPILYFIARWYKGDEQQQLLAIIERHLADPSPLTALDRALLLSAACNIGVSKTSLKPLFESLLASCQDGQWPAAALYVDPQYEGRQHYGGSGALTTAFALEALAAYKQPKTKAPAVTTSNQPSLVVKRALENSAALPDTSLRSNYQKLIHDMQRRDTDKQVTGMATTLAIACAKRVAADTLLQLNLGSLNGWIAYTIYDDFLDDEGDPKLLGVANFALRRSFDAFLKAVPRNQDFKAMVLSSFDQVDAANAWELRHARAKAQDGILQVKRLPNYKDHRQLAERSWGHSLAAVGVFASLGYKVDGPEVKHLLEFFQHFLIARQLNDDAHDWEADLSHGQLNAVVSLLLRDYAKLPLALDIKIEREALRLRFWQQTIVDVTALIQRHIILARRALHDCKAIQNSDVLESWLNSLEQASQQALRGREESQKFIAAYRKY